MTRPSRTLSRTLPSAILALLVITSVTNGQTRPEERNRPPVVTITKAGDGIPVLLRWRAPEERAERAAIVTARTAPSTVRRATLDGREPDVVLRGFTRPPMEKIWRISGRLATSDDGDATAQWRVIDGAARIFGVQGLARSRGAKDPKQPVDGEGATDAGPAVEDEDSKSTGIGTTKPKTPAAPAGPGPRDARDETRKLLGTGARQGADANVSSQESLDKAMELEKIADEAVGRTGGSTIFQTLAQGGLDPTSLRVRFLQPDRRAEYEMQTLLEAMRLAEVQLPNQPVAPGASWKAAWNGLVMRVPMRTEVTWTLVATDEAAKETNLAQTAIIRIEYQRRLQDPKDEPSQRELMLEADGRGQMEIRLDEPMILQARLVEQPTLNNGTGASRMVTRYQVAPIATP